MLKVSEPIKIKAKTSYVHDPEAFYHRITANYSLLESRISDEDLLHIVSTPPEIYVSEGEGMTSILNRSQNNVNNLQKVEILNNVLNRIVVSADMNLTYQDRVFITDALYKLGIRDDRRFMNAFYRMATETKNLNKLINLYLESGQSLREFVLSHESIVSKENKTELEVSKKETQNNLYLSILKKLKTGDVYQIVTDFNKNVNENELNRTEYNLSDQSYTAKHILLSELRQYAGITENNLVHFDNNLFEDGIVLDETNISDIKNDITSLVLQNVLKNIYHSGFDKLYKHNDTYFGFEDTFYKAADETFVKIFDVIQSNLSTALNKNEYANLYNSLTASEISILENAEREGIEGEELRKLTQIANVLYLQNDEDTENLYENLQLIYGEGNIPEALSKILKEEKTVREITPIELFSEILKEGNVTSVNSFVSTLNIENAERRNEYTQYIINLLRDIEETQTKGKKSKEKAKNIDSIGTPEIREGLRELIQNKIEKDEAGAEIVFPEETEETLEEQAEKIRAFVVKLNEENDKKRKEYSELISEMTVDTKAGKDRQEDGNPAHSFTEILQEDNYVIIREFLNSFFEENIQKRNEYVDVIENMLRLYVDNIFNVSENKKSGASGKISAKKIYKSLKSIAEKVIVEREGVSSPAEITFPEAEDEELLNKAEKIKKFADDLYADNRKKISIYEKYIETIKSKKEGTVGKALTEKNGEEPEEISRILDRLRTLSTVERTKFIEESAESINTTQELREITGEEDLTHPIEGAEEASEEKIRRLTESVNAIYLQNEQRRLEYLKALEKVEKKAAKKDRTDSIERTRKDAILALKNPEELKQKLEEQNESVNERKTIVMNEMLKLFPGRSAEIYKLINDYYSGDESIVQNNYLRPASLGELIYDINEASEEIETPKEADATKALKETEIIERLKRIKSEESGQGREEGIKKQTLIYNELTSLFPDQPERINSILNEYYGTDVNILNEIGAKNVSPLELIKDIQEAEEEGLTDNSAKARPKEAKEFLEAIKRERKQERQSGSKNKSFEEPVETVFRENETLSPEEFSEQLSEFRSNLSRQIKSEIRNESVSEESVSTRRELQTNETVNSQISSLDIQRMIESGVKREMNTISNQVINKLERQMRNEKVRRGYI